ncbi:hypothetical protein JCM33374_g678 [Metschnikowia sp. JCM 33374]|nr:hypothetical protein JCM33374_g678 [Metschnikowia sp. JCM 33374]
MSSSSKPSSIPEFQVAIRELTDDTIVNVQKSLETSLMKLYETNEYLTNEILNTTDDSDRQLYEETVAENNEVIVSQQSKLEVLKEELKVRNLLPGKEQEGIYL